jgi:hypothetical protein
MAKVNRIASPGFVLTEEIAAAMTRTRPFVVNVLGASARGRQFRDRVGGGSVRGRPAGALIARYSVRSCRSSQARGLCRGFCQGELLTTAPVTPGRFTFRPENRSTNVSL